MYSSYKYLVRYLRKKLDKKGKTETEKEEQIEERVGGKKILFNIFKLKLFKNVCKFSNEHKLCKYRFSSNAFIKNYS